MLGCLDDLASDFSVFHGIRDIGAMRPGTFLRLASRIGVYSGAVTAAAQAAGAAPSQQAHRRPGGQRPAVSLTPRTAASLPVASAEQLKAMLAKVPGSDTWGEVRRVKPDV